MTSYSAPEGSVRDCTSEKLLTGQAMGANVNSPGFFTTLRAMVRCGW